VKRDQYTVSLWKLRHFSFHSSPKKSLTLRGGYEQLTTCTIPFGDSSGRVPLQTLTANIDYSYKTASTIYGTIGIKAHFSLGAVLGHSVQRIKNGRHNKKTKVMALP
jgi:hypothetical protein